ncbi:MAG: fructose-bisphosphate aldolase class I [Pseudomonadota bacterium]|nr:fructose-bisphosphate aldolase class I [Pseudomonadota bacterium]
MNPDTLTTTAAAMMAPGKGLLAMDESTGTISKRFAAHGIPQTEAMRRAWREVLADAPGLGDAISGAILYDETIRQSTADGRRFVQVLQDAGIVPGIKVDQGTVDLAGHPDETITEGLDGLGPRLLEYAKLGARFAKWRAVIHIGNQMPSRAAIEANAHALARYAALCQAAALVPIVEPEVLMDGSHTLARCEAVTTDVLHAVFEQLQRQGVLLEGMVLKPNMVVPGLQGTDCDAVDAAADATVRCLRRSVPAAVAGIAFLSGGQSADIATARLKAMHVRHPSARARCPWPLTFSFGRALQDDALAAWAGDDAKRDAARQALLQRARNNGAALLD